MERDRLSARLLPLILLIASSTAAAVEVFPEQGAARSAAQVQQTSLQRLHAMVGQRPASSVATVELTDTDREKIATDNQQAPSGKPFKVGVVKPLAVAVDLRPLDVSAMGDQTYSFAGGTVRRTDGRLTWVMRLDAVGSAGARLRFDNVALPAGASIYLYNDAGDIKGPYSDTISSFWTHTIAADQVYVHVEMPDGASDDASFSIGAVLLFDDTANPFCPDNAPCIEDASCHTTDEWPALDQARKAIAHMNFIEDGWSYICSGGLLADTDPDTNIPYFLTADHCISTPQTARTLETWFDFRTPSCNGGCPSILPGSASTLGATLLSHSAVNDHSLLVLDEAPPADAWYLGWKDTPVAEADGTLLFRLSHPQGAPQAFSAHGVDRSTNPAEYCGTKTLPRGAYIFTRNVMGATEGGSSGAPLIHWDGQVVGQLFGICGYNLDDVCDAQSNITVDGAFANYYDRVAQWLNPDPMQLPLVVQKFGTGEGRVRSLLDDGTGATASVSGQNAGAVQPMLLGGAPVEQSEWPWQAALKVTTWQINGKWECGGTVIHPNWILTAAHCIVDDMDERFGTVAPSNIQVRTGSTRFEHGGQTSKVKRIVKHPEFNPLTRDHDIALIELKSPVYVDPLRPVTWEREAALACPGTLAGVTGWTPAEVCGQSAVALSKVDASIVDPDVCRDAYGDDDSNPITGNMLCSRWVNENEDDERCQDDSGSPLIVENGRGGYLQAGIVSRGNGCDSPKLPTVYTRLANHVEWMEGVTRADLSSDTSPGVIDCGSTCSARFAKDTVVTLTAEAKPGSVFGGWDGACAGMEDICQVNMTQALDVRAVFNATQPSSLSCASGSN